MSRIRIEDTISSTAFPGFGYIEPTSGVMTVSGIVPDPGRAYTISFIVPADTFIIGYYYLNETITPDYPAGRQRRIGNLPVAAIEGVGNNVYIRGRQSGVSYTVTVLVDNFSGGPLTVPTQTVNILIYKFASPFLG